MTSAGATQAVVEQATKLANYYGLGIVLSMLFALSFIGLVWIMIQSHERDRNRSHQRQSEMAVLMGEQQKRIGEFLTLHNQQVIDAFKSLHEDSQERIEQHKEMLRCLQEINSRVMYCPINNERRAG